METPLSYFRRFRGYTNANRVRILAWGLGLGMALYGIHWAEQPGLSIIFLPQIGLLLAVMCSAYYLMGLKKKPSLGSKYIWIPMLIIVVSIIGRAIMDFSGASLASGLYGIILFSIYLVSRELGKRIFVVYIPFVVIVALSCIYNGIAHPGVITGGIITNYCASVGFMIFGTVVNKFRWQWVLATIVLIALFFTGALEVVFIMGVLGITLLVKRDWSRKLMLPVALISIAIVVLVSASLLLPLYDSNNNLKTIYNLVTGKISFTEGTEDEYGYETEDADMIEKGTMDLLTTNRWRVARRVINDMQPLGHGFTPSIDLDEAMNNVHNAPLMITDQIGPVAGLAWLFITIFCLVKTKWRYAWVAILAMAVFDHYLWTQFALYWWALAGVSSATVLKSDYIFKENI